MKSFLEGLPQRSSPKDYSADIKLVILARILPLHVGLEVSGLVLAFIDDADLSIGSHCARNRGSTAIWLRKQLLLPSP